MTTYRVRIKHRRRKNRRRYTASYYLKIGTMVLAASFLAGFAAVHLAGALSSNSFDPETIITKHKERIIKKYKEEHGDNWKEEIKEQLAELDPDEIERLKKQYGHLAK